MGEGDTGASKKGGYAAEDPFSRLEAILENVYIRQQELKKLQRHKVKTEAARRYPGEVDGTAKVQAPLMLSLRHIYRSYARVVNTSRPCPDDSVFINTASSLSVSVCALHNYNQILSSMQHITQSQL
jgi:hypothetical protein